MGNWYVVTKRIHGRLYDYWQRTERHGKQVKTFNKYIGPHSSRGSVAVFSPNSDSINASSFQTDAYSQFPTHSPRAQKTVAGEQNKNSRTVCSASAESLTNGAISSASATTLPSPQLQPPLTTTPSPDIAAAKREVMKQFNPHYGLDKQFQRILDRNAEMQRREDERIQYGPRAARIRKMEKTIRAAKHGAKGTGALNAFLGRAINRLKDKT